MSTVKTDYKEGHRARLRSRYLQAGTEGMPDYDVMELLLTYCIQRRDVKPIARELFARFKSMGGIMDAEMTQLCEVPGLGENSALLIKLIRDLMTRYLESKMDGNDVISNTNELRDFVRLKLSSYSDEVTMVIFLNSRNIVLKTKIVARGTIDAAMIYPRNIAEGALREKAASVIIAHNHPSGITQPSKADKVFTVELQRTLYPLGVRLLDHLIVSRFDAFSFLDHGLIIPEGSIRL